MKRKDIMLVSAGGSAANNIFSSYFDLFIVVIGGTPFLQSILVSTRNLGNNILQGFWGTLSDRWGRKPFLAIGFLGMALTTVSFLFIRDMTFIVILVALQVLVGSMAIPAWNGLLGDITEKEERSQVVGSLASVGTLFAFLTLIFVGFLSQSISGELRQYYLIFLIASILFVITAVLSISLSKTPFVPQRRSMRFLDVLKDRRFFKFTMAYTIFLCSMALAWPLFSFVTVKVVAATKSQVSIMWGLSNVAGYIGQRFGGVISDRIGRRKSLYLFFTPLSVTAFCFGVADSWLWLLAGNVIAGFCTGAGFVAVAVYTLDCAPEELRASYSGTINLISGVGTFLSSLMGGYLATFLIGRIGLFATLRYMFFAVAFMRLAAGFVFLKVEETLS